MFLNKELMKFISQSNDKQQKIAILKRRLANTDYKAIKFAEGLISVEDYAPIKAQRQAWRDQINALEADSNTEQVQPEEPQAT